jgi:hypothetical protein
MQDAPHRACWAPHRACRTRRTGMQDAAPGCSTRRTGHSAHATPGDPGMQYGLRAWLRASHALPKPLNPDAHTSRLHVAGTAPHPGACNTHRGSTPQHRGSTPQHRALSPTASHDARVRCAQHPFHTSHARATGTALRTAHVAAPRLFAIARLSIRFTQCTVSLAASPLHPTP